ncbi:DOG1 domain-containing protein [Cephalotus follicularis]|uniref:DOG1 domain-containing protein n=1 Tax=Cephalotus follicularis TaxID=3775 RepID=A0A1Q3C5S1_CEPFO|nr:DOG1 domain-containing protein [Cephalotus follicularis]
MEESDVVDYMGYDELEQRQEKENRENRAWEGIERVDGKDICAIADRFQCVTIHKDGTSKKVDKLSWKKYALWRQKQQRTASRLEKQLKARWELEERIEELLNRFYAHYNQTMVPTRLKHVAQLLVPKWAAPQELAPLSWLGDWRPSAILDLLHGMTHSSSSSLSDSTGTDQLLSQLISEIRIEEAIIDEELAEIQATCVLHLPFSPVNKQSGAAALDCVQNEFKKIGHVMTKAQQIRFKALKMVVKKVLNPTDAAEFFVAFTRVQDVIHQYAKKLSSQKSPVMVPVAPKTRLVIGKKSVRNSTRK